MTALKRPQFLVVDDEVAMVRLLELLLRPLGDVTKVYSVPEATEALGRGLKADCIITDVCMPEASGLELLDIVRKKYPEIPVVVMTAFSSVPQAVEAIQRGAFEYIVKPFENVDMVEAVKRAIKKKGLSIGETKRMPTGWICNSVAMQDFISKLQRLKDSETPILILGEGGAGKRRAAQWLHDESMRNKKDFLVVDGRAHEEDSSLLDPKVIAKGGTLYVAEVMSLSKRLQDRLLEVLREGKWRIIASTSAGTEFQSSQNFREDLWNELRAVTVEVPALRQRTEDLEALTSEMLSSLAQKLKREKLELHQSALEKLKAYSFPGNVRELEQILERAAIESKGTLLPAEVIQLSPRDLRGHLPFAIPLEEGWSRLDLLKESLERDLIERALDQFPESSNTEIAAMLGTTRRILELRMKQYRIRDSS